jgi:hypothetical protein
MIAISTNIYDFTNWMKYGTRTVSSEMLIDLSDINSKTETLLAKVGLFEEDFEIFFCVLDEKCLKLNDKIFQVTVHQITEIKPLSAIILPILKEKLGGFKIGSPVDKILYDKLHKGKLKKISYDGWNYMKESFTLSDTAESENLFNSLFIAKTKYFFETSHEKDSWFDYLISYERTKPYPISDIGFLYDVGAIYRERFYITDNDIANREILKTSDPSKYELISHIIELSKFLQTANQESPFSTFIKFSETSELIKDFSKELHQKEIPENLNHALLYACFFKFRKLIRDTNDLTESKFISQVEKFIKGSKDETTIALLMCGLMFGSLKLKELFYASKLLTISDISEVGYEKIEESIPKPPTRKKKKTKVDIDVTPASKQSEHVNDDLFDEGILLKLSPLISSYPKQIHKSITKIFNDVLNTDKKLDCTKKEYFVKCLYVEARKNQTTTNKNKLKSEIVDKVRDII